MPKQKKRRKTKKEKLKVASVDELLLRRDRKRAGICDKD